MSNNIHIDNIIPVLETLTKAQQRILRWKLLDGLTDEQIPDYAKQVGLPIQTVYDVREHLDTLVYTLLDELGKAMRIQEMLFPELPSLPGLNIAAKYWPAIGMTGDFYDFIPIDGNGRWGITIGDGKGHGTRAAMLVTPVHTQLHKHAPTCDSVSDMLHRLDFDVWNSCQPFAEQGEYVTLLYGVLDTQLKTFTYGNAAHPPLLLYNQGTQSFTEGPSTGPYIPRMRIPIGGKIQVFGEQYGEKTIQLQPGDMLLMYTDGITESMAANKEPFGQHRLKSLVKNHAHLAPDELTEIIYEAVVTFSGRNPLFDDATVLILKVDQKGERI